jgi:hypothetical protein
MESVSIIPDLKEEAAALQEQLVAWRRDFHEHPELGFQEVRTAGIVAEHLQDLGLEVSTGVGKTGVVALVEPDDLAPDAPTVNCGNNNTSNRTSINFIRGVIRKVLNGRCGDRIIWQCFWNFAIKVWDVWFLERN